LNKRACEFAQKNVFANKVKEYVSIVQGDSRKHCLDLAKRRKTFDFILMLRPNLEDTFLDAALNVAHKGTIVYYHGFGEEEAVKKEVMDEIRKSTPKGVSSAEQKRKISNFKIRKAGDIGVNKWRWNISFKVL
jgi:tRNA G37 N-methylase Trm5